MSYTTAVGTQLGSYMARWRADKNLSLRAAGASIHVSHSTWGDIENGVRKAGLVTLIRLSDLFDTPLETLMEWQGDPLIASKDDNERIERTARLMQQSQTHRRIADLLPLLQPKTADFVLTMIEGLILRESDQSGLE